MNKDYNQYRISVGNYDLAHPKDKQVQIIFYLKDDAPFERKTMGFVVWDDGDGEESFTSPYDAAIACKKYIDRRLYNPDKPKIAKLVEYLETTMYQDHLEELRNQKTKYEKILEKIEREIRFVEEEMKGE